MAPNRRVKTGRKTGAGAGSGSAQKWTSPRQRTGAEGRERRTKAADEAGSTPRPIREDLVRALSLEAYGAIRDEGRVADRTLDFLLRRETRLYASERRAVAEAVYGLLRSELRLEALLEDALGPALRELAPSARRALFYEALRVQDRKIAPARALADGGFSTSLLQGLQACADPTPLLERLADDPARRLAVAEGLPLWMAELFLRELGPMEGPALAEAMNRRAPLTIRANALRTDREALRRRLAAEGVNASPTRLSPDALQVDGRLNLFHLPSFRDGLFEIQDEGSQLLARLLAPKPGWLVVDACAGAGGKTLALAAMMENKGRLIALDSDERRLASLAPRANRAGVHNWESHAIPADRIPKRLAGRLVGKADAVLIDAPCTGLGVLRRNPDARFRLDEGSVAQFAALQREILIRYAALAKPGGRIVYATCSISREENEEVVEAILADHPEFEIVAPEETLGAELARGVGGGRYLRLMPHVHGTDGFFAALLRRRS